MRTTPPDSHVPTETSRVALTLLLLRLALLRLLRLRVVVLLLLLLRLRVVVLLLLRLLLLRLLLLLRWNGTRRAARLRRTDEPARATTDGCVFANRLVLRGRCRKADPRWCADARGGRLRARDSLEGKLRDARVDPRRRTSPGTRLRRRPVDGPRLAASPARAADAPRPTARDAIAAARPREAWPRHARSRRTRLPMARSDPRT
mmetsp:Transcript_5515/g.34121  ORF Transcript_5515/g.34121 Transcript_5515/m.34121 type:complete len:204 (+) Transcript_5515:1459-2070(+)